MLRKVYVNKFLKLTRKSQGSLGVEFYVSLHGFLWLPRLYTLYLISVQGVFLLLAGDGWDQFQHPLTQFWNEWLLRRKRMNILIWSENHIKKLFIKKGDLTTMLVIIENIRYNGWPFIQHGLKPYYIPWGNAACKKRRAAFT